MTNPPPLSAADLFKKGIALAKNGKKKEARWTIQQSVLLEPKNEAAWLYLAAIADNFQDAMDAIELVETINPANPHLDKAKTWAKQRWPQPAPHSQAAPGRHTPSKLGGPFTRGLLISAVVIAGLAALALGFFYQNVTANFTSTLTATTSTISTAKQLNQAHLELETAQTASNRPAMIAALEKIHALQPTDADAGAELARLYYEQGVKLRDDGNFLEAKNSFARALAAQPNFEPAQTEARLVNLYLNGVDHHQQAEWAEAVADFRVVYNANPDYPYLNEILYSAYFNLGLVKTHENRPSEALDAYRQAVKILPDAPEAPKKVRELSQLLYPPTATPVPANPPQKRIVVDISEQHCYVYEDDKQIHDFIISTGEPGRDTAVGEFEVLDKIPMAYASTWNLDMPYWLGIYWSGSLQNGFHALPTVRQTGYTLWDGYLGQRVSYGCIILSLKDAETLFNWAEVGTPVTIQP